MFNITKIKVLELTIGETIGIESFELRNEKIIWGSVLAPAFNEKDNFLYFKPSNDELDLKLDIDKIKQIFRKNYLSLPFTDDKIIGKSKARNKIILHTKQNLYLVMVRRRKAG